MSLIFGTGKPESVDHTFYVPISIDEAEEIIKRYKKDWEGDDLLDVFLGCLIYCLKHSDDYSIDNISFIKKPKDNQSEF